MFSKKHILILFLFLVVLFGAVSQVSANDLNATDEMAVYDEGVLLDGPDVSFKTFSDLNKTINDNNDSDIYLDSNYIFNSTYDSDFKYGIEITRGITIHGNGHIINASKEARIFMASGKGIVFRDITFLNGRVDYNEGQINGGAITGDVTCINCSFIGNGAVNAGAMNRGTVINCTFKNNFAHYWGGAMYDGYVYNCTFIDNRADYGGALWYCYACENSVFINNFASLTGGAINHAPVVNCTFINNYAQQGGAVRSCSAVNSVFINNRGYYGGAMFSVVGDSAINCTFTNNTAHYEGGALHGLNSVNCTFNNNSAPDGGAMYHAYCFDSVRYARQDRDINYVYCINSTFCSNHADNEGGAVYNIVVLNSLFEDNRAKVGGAMCGIRATNCTFRDNYASVCGGAVVNAEVDYDSIFKNNTSPLGNNMYNTTYIGIYSTFMDLNKLINDNNLSEIYLNEDYVFNPLSDLDFIDGVKINRAVTVFGNGHTIDGSYLSRAFDVFHNNKVVFKDIIFTNCISKNWGGAIYGISTAVNCTFINNMAESAGALAYCDALNCTFVNNSAIDYGAMSSGNAQNCIFINNYAEDDGGAFNHGSALNCTFINNHAENGGAIGSGSALNSTFINNTASKNGGAIHNYESYMVRYVVKNCEFINNTALNGGATYNVNLAYCYFTNNHANNSGGAMYNGVSTNSNFISNDAGIEGGAIYDVVCANSLFEYNHAQNGGAMSGGKATNITFNCNNATVGGAVYNAEVSFDSRFKNNLPNDTFNATFFEKEYLKTFSDLNALINGKDDEVVYLNDDYTFDIAYDFEFMSGININRNVTVIGNANTIDANYNARVFMVLDGNVTFSNIRFVNAKSGDGSVINGKSTSINCTFINNSAENYYGGVMYNGYAIYCTFINNRAYYGGAMYYGSAVNCTFINNSADRCGGAIHYGSSAVNCTFINNSADYGGAIYYGSSPVNCTFINNSADYGGAVCEGYTSEGCTFINNSANHDGGALYKTNARNCIFINNSAVYGGAVYLYNSIKCTFINNSADYGGAVKGGDAYCCIFKNNTAAISGNDLDGGRVYPGVLSASDFVSHYGSGKKLLVTLKANTVKIAGENITIHVYKDNILIGTYYCLSGDGWIVDLDSGSYTAVLSVENHNVTPINVTLTITKIYAILSSQSVKMSYDTEGYLVATLMDVYGNVLGGKVVSVDLCGVRNLTTDENGQVNFTVDLPAGSYVANVSFDGDDNYLGSSRSVNVDVDKVSTELNVSDISTTYNVAKYLVITLKDAGGNVLGGKELSVDFNGIKKLTTNENGQVMISSYNLAPKNYVVAITFDGDENYLKSATSANVLIKKAAPKLTASKKTFKVKTKTKKYTVTLKNNKNKVIKNAKLTLKVKGKTYNATTNAKGQAIFKISKLTKKGTFTATVKYEGSKYYSAKTVSTKITCK